MSMTDPRAVARQVLSHLILKLERTDGGSILSFNQDGMVSLLAQALADAERRGMERAATIVEEMYRKPERIWDADTLDGVINTIRAQAQADKEG